MSRVVFGKSNEDVVFKDASSEVYGEPTESVESARVARTVKSSKSSNSSKSVKSARKIESSSNASNRIDNRSSNRVSSSVASSSASSEKNSVQNSVQSNSQSATLKNAFVDARRLSVVDFVKQTLKSSAGPLGIASRPKVIDFSAREKEEKSARIRTFLLRFAYTFLVVAIVGLLCWLLFLSPVFRLSAKNIRIFGSNEWVSGQKIASIASNQVDKSLFLVSSQQIIEQLNNIPGVTETKVVKQFPQGLQITVRAQKPAAMLKTRVGEKLTAVDVKGRVLNAVENVSTSGIPVIEVSDVRRSLGSKAVKEALKIVSSLSEDFRARVTRVSAKTQDSVETEISCQSAYGDIHRVVVWGDSSDLELKKAIVETIIDDPSKIGNRQQLDVSAPARPILK